MARLPGSYGAQYEWSGWTTLNVMTAGECAITAYAYNSRSGTRPTEDVPEGAETGDKSAVWIMTIGYGYGGTNNKPKNITQSELKKDISYSSHPTGVRFWYKYAPYKGDKTDIKVEIYNGETLIGDGQLQTDEVISSYQPYLLNINYLNEYIDLKPDKLVLLFKSGFNTEVEKRESFSGSWWQSELTNSNMANPMFRGSELFIDDVELIYDK
ncbi:hypothetical protein NXW80_20555 [Bacteroides fragilis]|nr:hypothetical protein [Bacteroides fragilis]